MVRHRRGHNGSNGTSLQAIRSAPATQLRQRRRHNTVQRGTGCQVFLLLDKGRQLRAQRRIAGKLNG
ncbi:hypothetical protein RZR10_08190 [Enterobacter asburiae]|uniref:hypothetical protein n=1 Tax=Enterobacter asburiae TaxID=61645 RepID=UPI00292A769C|nr:hypothetical protein [Enterobacter asburiae]MDV1793713.1 hypothetical protein [Enterobacter asburiae]